MKRSRSKRDQRSSLCLVDVEPLRSVQRGDGVWESIETDQDDGAATAAAVDTNQDEVEVASTAPTQANSPRATPTRPSTSPHQVANVKSTGTQTSEPHHSPPSPTRIPPVTIGVGVGVGVGAPAAAAVQRATTPTRADLIARVLHCPLPHPGLGLPDQDVVHAPLLPAPELGHPPPPSNPERRQRGRPRKAATHHPPHRRRVRFSDPAPSEAEPELRSRDSHVFVRLVKVNIATTIREDGSPLDGDGDGDGDGRRLLSEYVWNNRVKGWRSAAAARRSSDDGGFVELAGLFASPSSPGGAAGSSRGAVLLRPVILPIEGGGVRQPVEMAWDGDRFCFQGVNQDGETLSVTLGEMRESARDPWARQFVGYVMR